MDHCFEFTFDTRERASSDRRRTVTKNVAKFRDATLRDIIDETEKRARSMLENA